MDIQPHDVQVKAQEAFVAQTSECTCIIYHPVGEDLKRLYATWVANGSPSDMQAAQLFGFCHTRGA